MMKRIGVLRFPGTNCDRDVFEAIEVSGLKPEWLWHQDRFSADDFDGYVVPGGFSYGDYLRAGAMASRSVAIEDLKLAVEKGKPVLGICNGFQVLCEASLLPGALLRNHSGRFIDKWVSLKVTKTSGFWQMGEGSITLPIAHGEGCYYINTSEIENLRDNDQIWFSYQENPNGSVADIAGITNKEGNVAALMPHPERAMSEWMGGEDGRRFFDVFR